LPVYFDCQIGIGKHTVSDPETTFEATSKKDKKEGPVADATEPRNGSMMLMFIRMI